MTMCNGGAPARLLLHRAREARRRDRRHVILVRKVLARKKLRIALQLNLTLALDVPLARAQVGAAARLPAAAARRERLCLGDRVGTEVTRRHPGQPTTHQAAAAAARAAGRRRLFPCGGVVRNDPEGGVPDRRVTGASRVRHRCVTGASRVRHGCVLEV